MVIRQSDKSRARSDDPSPPSSGCPSKNGRNLIDTRLRMMKAVVKNPTIIGMRNCRIVRFRTWARVGTTAPTAIPIMAVDRVQSSGAVVQADYEELDLPC